MNNLERTGSAFDKQGVIAKRKRWAIIAVVVIVLLAIVIGVGVSVSMKKEHKGKSGGKPSATAPSAAPAAPPVKSKSVSSRPIVREARMNGRVNPELLSKFLDELAARVSSIPGLSFTVPDKFPVSFRSLLMYIRDMNAVDLYDALLDYADSLDISKLSLTAIPKIVEQAQYMLSTKGLKAWNELLAIGHDLAAGNHTHPAVNVTALRSIATTAGRNLPSLAVTKDALVKYKNYTATNTSVPTNSAAGAGRRLAGAGKATMGRKLAAGEAAFEDLCIPIVFHVLQFALDDGFGGVTSFPGTGSTADAQNLIDNVNYLFNNTELSTYFGLPPTPTKVQFQLGAVVDTPTTATYLGVSEDMWAGCYNDEYNADMERIGAAATAAYPSSQYVNVIVCGDPGDGTGTLGYAWVPSGPVAEYDEDGAAPPQFIFLRVDEFLSTFTNNAESFQRGSTTLAHELGHHLGLRHPHPQVERGAEECSDGDGMEDTPTTKIVQVQPYALDLQELCEYWRIDGVWPSFAGSTYGYTLGLMSSCLPDTTIDPVFNIMEYTPTACYSHFTPEQVALLQTAIAAYRPGLYASSKGVCPVVTDASG